MGDLAEPHLGVAASLGEGDGTRDAKASANRAELVSE